MIDLREYADADELAAEFDYDVHELAAAFGLPLLPFIPDDVSSLWAPPPPTGIQDRDIATGIDYARRTIAFARAVGDPHIIIYVFNDIIKRGIVGHIEAGFLGVICSSAYAGTFN